MWNSSVIRPFATVPFWTPSPGRGPNGTGLSGSASADLAPGVELLLAIGNPRDRILVRLLVGLALLLLRRLLRLGLGGVRIGHVHPPATLLGEGRRSEHGDDDC